MNVETKKGLGCDCGTCGPCGTKASVYAMLAKGSPRLAYAVARGIPLAPWYLTLSATFSTTTQAVAANRATDQKLVQDTIITKIDYQIQNLNTPTSNFSSFAANQFATQSGIQARMKVIGGPRYAVVDDFMPISLLPNRPCGWLLGATQGVSMDFQSTMTLPFVPLIVTVTLYGETTYWDKLFDMPPATALKLLSEMGYDLGPYDSTT